MSAPRSTRRLARRALVGVALAALVLVAGGCTTTSKQAKPRGRTWRVEPTPHSAARHRAHEHPHGPHPHPSGGHHHHPHPHPHLAGQNGHHHPY